MKETFNFSIDKSDTLIKLNNKELKNIHQGFINLPCFNKFKSCVF